MSIMKSCEFDGEQISVCLTHFKSTKRQNKKYTI